MATFSLGYNFDYSLLDNVAALNAECSNNRISEVFAAIKIGPVPSARSRERMKDVSLPELSQHVAKATSLGLSFNYLMNTSVIPERRELGEWLGALEQCGIDHVTVGRSELARLVAELAPQMQTTLSLTARTSTTAQIYEAVDAGIDNIYLDAVSVNRDFRLLRELVKAKRPKFRLYANVSCISHCPVMDSHYQAFERSDSKSETINKLLFFSCSIIKASSPVEWMQMPWIRPEDISAYALEGIDHFKLSDRLASTPSLLAIAKAYLGTKSPDNFFPIIERDGGKYAEIWEDGHTTPFVASDQIPENWLSHFQDGYCLSRDTNCPTCNSVANSAILSKGHWPAVKDEALDRRRSLPRSMQKRIQSNPMMVE